MKKKLFFSLLLLIFSTNMSFAEPDILTRTSENILINNSKAMDELNQRSINKLIIFNDLHMEQEQKQKVFELFRTELVKESPLLIQITEEKEKLQTLKVSKATSKELKEQSKVIQNLTKTLKKTRNESDKKICELLSRHQKSKYKELIRKI